MYNFKSSNLTFEVQKSNLKLAFMYLDTFALKSSKCRYLPPEMLFGECQIGNCVFKTRIFFGYCLLVSVFEVCICEMRFGIM
jgi:hypothetical protein